MARRLISIVVSDFLCWFPIGLLGILSSTGLPVPGEVSVALAIFVLPLNSALNPYLYSFNMLIERRRAELVTRLSTWIEASKATPTSFTAVLESGASHKRLLQDIKQYIRDGLDSGEISVQDIKVFLLSVRKNAE